MTPRVSILTPTLNSARTLELYFSAIRAQRYPQDAIEIVIADGGSTDNTVEIARAHGAKVVPNPLKTGEAGKAVALAHATGDFVALIDSDNILVGEDWLTRMLAPFSDENVMGTEPMAFFAEHADSIVDRYCALAGVNDPLCLYMGNYDKWSAFSGRWTGMNMQTQECGDYVSFALNQPLPTIGANGTMYRRSALEWFHSDYFMDIDIPTLLGRRNPHAEFAKVRVSIRHLFCRGISQFALKQTRRVRDFFAKEHRVQGERIYPWHLYVRGGIARFLLSSVTVVPVIFQALKGYERSRDTAMLFHPIACWITLYVYGMNFLLNRGKSLSRENWQHSQPG